MSWKDKEYYKGSAEDWHKTAIERAEKISRYRRALEEIAKHRPRNQHAVAEAYHEVITIAEKALEEE